MFNTTVKQRQPNLFHHRRAVLEIDTTAAKKNYDTFRKLLKPQTKLLAVIKSNAYGHDLLGWAKLMDTCGVDWFGVDSALEGFSLRETGITKPILVLGYTLPANFALAKKHNLTLTISSWENLQYLKKVPLPFHLKVDTGMGRQGFVPSDMPAVIKYILADKNLIKNCRGVYTHFADAKNPAFPKNTFNQIKEFEQTISALNQAGLQPLRHAAASAGTLLFPQAHYDMVRVGMSLYGYWPAAEVRGALEDTLTLSPTLTWKTIIAEIKKLPVGSKIGYDLTETLTTNSTVAICPVGYWDGYPRLLSSIGHVLVGGKRCRVLGRVSMEMLVIDVSTVPQVKVGSEVVLLGKQNKSEITAEEIALLAQTSAYEIITRLNPLMKREFV
jgi:alanine racemase